MSLTTIPGSLISPDAALPTGVGPVPFMGSTPPAGWVLADGRTIGSAASGATNRANADTQALFILLWTSLSNAVAPVSGGRGASAAADFAANKTLTLPDCRGRVAVFRDNMGGTAANRMTTGGSGVDGSTLGAAGGSETHTLTIAQIPPHTHAIGGSAVAGGASSENAAVGTVGATGSTGGGSAHNNTQPSIITNALLKL